PGRTGVPPVPPGILPGAGASAASPFPATPAANPSKSPGSTHHRRNLPHFEKPWAVYHLIFKTRDHFVLSREARQITLDALTHFHKDRYELFAACVMPDHVHVLLQPRPKENDADGKPVFWPLSDLMHSIKSFTSKEINQLENIKGRSIWQEETFDRFIRSDADLEEKFQYICENPWTDGLAKSDEQYPFIWTPALGAARTGVEDGGKTDGPAGDAALEKTDSPAPGRMPGGTGGTPVLPVLHASGMITGDFAFNLYDEQGFPYDLTELMAREHGLTVDKERFEELMAEQRKRSQDAQKGRTQVIKLSEIETKEPTNFLGYDNTETEGRVLEVVNVADKTAIILDATACYAEMGGQLG
ncbi:MAG: hypothetical protein EOO09_22805, partial [Chitinophagaceae bacterium]